MITKDYQGNALPPTYNTTVQGDNRSWLAKLIMNGSELSCGIKQIDITKGSCGSDTEFTIGNLISSMLVADLRDLTVDVKGEEIEVRIGLEISGVYQWVSVGVFTIATVEKNLYTTTITGYGKIVSNGGIGFPDLVAPTIAQVGAYIGTELGCTVTLDPSIDDTLTIGQPMVGLTTYQALQVLANTVGGYAIDTADGNVKVCLYDDTPTHTVNAGLMIDLPEVEEQDFSVTGIRVTVSEESYDVDGTIPAVGYDSTTPINLIATNPYMTQDLFDDMESHLVGYTYRPAHIGLTLGDPRIEGDDVLTVVDADNSTYVVPCHMVKHTYTGGFHTEIIAVGPTDSADGIGSITPLQSKLDNLNSGVVTARSEASKAQTIANTTKQHFWFWDTIPAGADPLVGTGAHISEVSETDFNDSTSPLYHSGGNLLARSNGIAVRDGLTELATFGASGETIGVTDGTQSYLAMDYHSMRMIDKEGDAFFHVSDLRDASGYATVVDTFTGDGILSTFYLQYGLDSASDIISVTINGIATTSYTVSSLLHLNVVTFTTVPANGDAIVITYKTSSSFAKAFTFGYRNSSAQIGGESVALGQNVQATKICSFAEGMGTKATGQGAHAEGSDTEASGLYSHAEGEGTLAEGGGSHAGGLHTIAGYNWQTVIGTYNKTTEGNIDAWNSPLVIGNGGYNNRSNAFMFTDYGDILMALDTNQASGTDHDIYTALTALGWASNVIV